MFVKKGIAEYVCVYGGAHMHAFRSWGFTSGPAWRFCVWLCPTGTPYIRSGGVPLNELGFVLSYSRGTILIISSEKTGSNFVPTGPECHTVYAYEKELSANLRAGFPFPFWGQRKDSESIGNGYITSFLLCSSFWQISEGHCIEQLSKLDWIGQGDWTREADGHGVCVCVCVWERERKRERERERKP